MLDGVLCFGLRGQRNEGNIGDDVDGLATDLGDLLTLRDGDEVRSGCEIQETW